MKKPTIKELLSTSQNPIYHKLPSEAFSINTTTMSKSIPLTSPPNEAEKKANCGIENRDILASNNNVSKSLAAARSDIDTILKGSDIDYFYFSSKKSREPIVKTTFFKANRSSKRNKRLAITKFLKECLKPSFMIYLRKNGLAFEPRFYKIGDITPDVKIKYVNNTMDKIDQKKQNRIHDICRAKDLTYMSDNNYDKFRKIVNPKMTSLYYVRKARSVINNNLYKIYRNNFGNYVNCEQKISAIVKQKLKFMKITDNTIIIKLCGDGTQAGKKNTILNFCFTLPQEGNIAKTSMGNYTLGIFAIKREDYKTLSQCLEQISFNLSQLKEKGINIAENENIRNFKVRFLLSGDMKFLRAAMGLNGCNSNHCCVWCKEEKKNFPSNNIIIHNSKKRSLNDLKNMREIDGSINEIEGYQNKPIFDFIGFDDVLFDTLHMLLRITGKLLKILANELIVLDEGNTCDLDKMPNQKKLFDYLLTLGINMPYKVLKNDDSKPVIQMRSFNGNECLKILKEIDFNDLFPCLTYPESKNNEFNKVYHDFYDIFTKVKENFYIENSKLLETDTDEWLKAFSNSFNAKHVTPYMHLFSSHMCFFVKNFGDVDVFNIQGLEKLNDKTTRQYFLTNRQRFYTFQMMARRNRLEHYCLNDGNITENNTRVITHKLKKMRQDIAKKEDTKTWCQYLVHETPLFNLEIENLKNDGCLSENVVIMKLAFNLLKTNETLFMNQNELRFLLDEQFELMSNVNLSVYKKIVSQISDSSFIYISIESKFICYVNLLPEDNCFEQRFLKSWTKYFKYLNSNDQFTEWKIKKFKHNNLIEKYNLSVGLLLCFEHLMSSKFVCKFNSTSFKSYRIKLLNLFKKESRDFNEFCTSCARSCVQEDANLLFECQCSRRLHKACLDSRYITKNLYQYESFLCFFCRNKI